MTERKRLGQINFTTDDDLTIAQALVDYIRSDQFSDAGVYNVETVLRKRTAAKVELAEPALAARIVLMKSLLERTVATLTDFLRVDEKSS